MFCVWTVIRCTLVTVGGPGHTVERLTLRDGFSNANDAYEHAGGRHNEGRTTKS